MKPIISKKDYTTLRELIFRQSNNSNKKLGESISQLSIVEDDELDQKIIRLNSMITVKDLSSGKGMKLQIVLPDLADLKSQRISVFAPMSTVLLGFGEGDTVCWNGPSGIAHFQIVKVINP